MPSLVQPGERAALDEEVRGATRERMLREMAEAIEALSAEQPLVLVLEDLHWSDGSTVDLLSALARRRESARVLVIGTYRPGDVVLDRHPLRAMKQDLQAAPPLRGAAARPARRSGGAGVPRRPPRTASLPPISRACCTSAPTATRSSSSRCSAI